LPFYNRPWGI